MAGLNFLTETIINSKVLGKDKDGKDKAAFAWIALDADTDVEAHAFIQKDFHFWKDDALRGKVCTIRKRAGHEAKMAKVEIDFTSLAEQLQPEEGQRKAYGRLDLYISAEGAEPYVFASPWVQKGKPFWMEFVVKKGDTAATIVKNIVSLIKKYHIFLLDTDVVKATANGAKLTLEAQQEFLRFSKVNVCLFNDVDEDADIIAELPVYDEDTKLYTTGAVTVAEKGENAFGAYSQIVKDLRLPTLENTSWTRLRQSEAPIVGAIYDQYLIEYDAPAVNDGIQAVGERLNSVTLHSFWVNHEVASDFETVLANLVDEIEDVDA